MDLFDHVMVGDGAPGDYSFTDQDTLHSNT